MMPSDPFASTGYMESSDADASGADIDPRLVELANSYAAALRSGERPNREEYLSRFPDLRDEATDYLEGIEIACSLEPLKSKSDVRSAGHGEIRTGEPIGDFRIVQEIGRGGMGTVYEAVQISLGRHVALKVLPFAAALDERHRKRFLLEAQAAAQLHHNHIVPVYAVGCERGTHYYAMQLINGKPVSAKLFDEPWIATSLQTTPTLALRGDITMRSSMSSPQTGHRDVLNRFQRIASLVADAAEGLDYAHSCGIVHRDVKPGNLLLDVHGKIWITDFGLAHVTTGEHVTQTGDMLGTMRYMSPEQASGAKGVVDHRSDVYALGATLYELLTHQPVHDGADRQTLLRQVLNDDPRPLRQLERSIPEELEIITLKALRHSPAERYETAQHFADDLRRYLSQMPITARRPTILDQTRKWMRRHPTAVVSLLFAMAVAMISLATTTAIVAHQKSLTQQSLDREERRATQAERRLATAQAAADEMISLAENEFSRTPMEETLRLRLLSSALVYYQALIDDSDIDSKVRTELQVTRSKVEQIRDGLSLLRDDRELMLLNDPAVLADLRLNEIQQDQLANLGPLLSTSSIEFDRVERAQARKTEIDKILTSMQRTRLRQIGLQLQGPSAMFESLISGDLELTESQISSIQRELFQFLSSNIGSISQSVAVSNAGTTDSESPFRRPGSFRPDEMLDANMKQELLDVMLQHLTPDQLRAWAKIAGPRFAPK
jgi:serine/threonine protein kinase